MKREFVMINTPGQADVLTKSSLRFRKSEMIVGETKCKLGH
jgi:hypothetical protein